MSGYKYRIAPCLFAAVWSIASACPAAGEVVSVSFGRTATPADREFAPGDLLGAIEAAGNWNVTTGNSPSMAAGTVVNDSGAVVPGLSFLSTGGQNTGDRNTTSPLLEKLYDDFLGRWGSPMVLNLNGISGYASYDLYPYLNTFPLSPDHPWTIDVNGATRTVTDPV